MTFNDQGGSIENRIVTSFTTEGDAKVEGALARLQARQQAYFQAIEKGSKQTATTTDLINKAFDKLNKNNALEKLRKEFLDAARSGADINKTMERLAPALERVGAKQADINRLVLEGAKAFRKEVEQAQALQEAILSAPTSNIGGIPGAGGGGRSRGATSQRLQSLGRELRLQLPAVPIGSFSSEQGARLVEISGRISGAFEEMGAKGRLATVGIGALTAGIAALAIGASAVNEQFSRQTRAIIASQEEYTRLRLSGSREEIAAALEKQRLENQIARDRATELKGVLDGLREQSGPVGAALSDIFNVAGAQELRKALEEQEQAIQTGALAESRLAGLRKDTAVATRLAAEAEERARKETSDLRVDLALAWVDAAIFTRTATVEEFDQRKRDLEAELTFLKTRRQQLQRESPDDFDALHALEDRIHGVLVQLEAYDENLRRSTEITDRAAKAEQYLKDQRKELIDVTEKFNSDVEKMELQATEQRLAIQQKFNDRIIDLAQKAADAAEDALRKLEQKRDDLKLDLGRDQNDEQVKFQEEQLDAQIEFQRDEAKAARDHANTLKEIDRKSKYDSQQAIQDRDAIALQAAEDEKTQSIQSAQDEFAAEKREREIAFRDTLADNTTQFNRERQQRMLKYQRDLEDAQAQYSRELEQQNINNARSLRDLMVQTARELTLTNDKNAQQLKLVRDAYAQELQIVAMGQGARLQLAAQHEAMLIMQARRSLMGMSQAPTTFPGGPSRTMATGGNLRAGQTALTNEIRRESWTERGGRTIALPEGRGWFTPTSDGRVNQTAGGGGTIQLNMNGATVQTIDIRSRQQAMQVFSDVLDEVGVAG